MQKQELAKESEKTLKAREKLKKRLSKIEQKVTQEALKHKIKEMHLWISRHAKYRITLPNKKIALFDENKNSAQLSKYVSVISKKIKEDLLFFSEKKL